MSPSPALPEQGDHAAIGCRDIDAHLKGIPNLQPLRQEAAETGVADVLRLRPIADVRRIKDDTLVEERKDAVQVAATPCIPGSPRDLHVLLRNTRSSPRNHGPSLADSIRRG